MKEDRIAKEKVQIDDHSIQEFYSKRAREKGSVNIDAPVILSGDTAPEKIAFWTNYEIENRLPLAQIDSQSKVLELGFGTGRISKFITPKAELYVGIDYVAEFVDIVSKREDVHKDAGTYFLQGSLQDLAAGRVQFPKDIRFNRFVISGGVLLYINDEDLKVCLEKLVGLFDDHCIMYMSEPIALQERLTLNKFYSEDLKAQYSAIYRTEAEYKALFAPLFAAGFEMKVSEEFFYEDIKGQKETRQWMFVLEK